MSSPQTAGTTTKSKTPTSANPLRPPRSQAEPLPSRANPPVAGHRIQLTLLTTFVTPVKSTGQQLTHFTSSPLPIVDKPDRTEHVKWEP
ncbi:hypothetical protein H2198_000158 [Neophaeococcomyces mojaviensis]|uniref:Uncharacterized protein n=1 Tax=Neophaeococcomyces mojaviensis TaxID=3383035 RepID=A0ACC3AKH0_9EURO|nr:hypothetical protein H2198_000158 [Knufia sp. JES_112]